MEIPDAVLGVALAALWADGRERPAEVQALRREIERLDVFDGIEPGHLTALAADLRETYAAQGVAAYLDRQAALLDPARATQALTVAIDVVLADREVTGEELAFLHDLRDHLGIPPAEVDRIVDVLETKHGLPLAATSKRDPEAAVEEPIGLSEASIAFAVAAARAASPGEAGPDRRRLAPIRARSGIPETTFSTLIERVQHRLTAEGADTYLAACADRLEGPDRERAFAWAADVVLADRQVSGPEHGYLTEIRSLLGVEPSRASRIVDVLWAKHLR